MDDDGLEEYDRIERNERERGQTYWTGRAEGGPIDGSGVTIEAAPHLAMRGLQLSVCVGENVDTAAWHVYAFGERADDASGLVSCLMHLGTIDGDPKLPPNSQE